MSNIMQGGAFVEPKALKKMKEDTDKLGDDLKKTSNSLLKKVDYLNEKGFQDGNFERLNQVIQEHAGNLNKLHIIMESFSLYLGNVEKNISQYVNSNNIPSTNITVG